MRSLLSALEATGAYAPWCFVLLFAAASLLMIWRLEALTSRGVEGTVLGSQLTLRIAYRNPGSGCDGIAEATATIGQGGATFSGPATITECGQAMGASLSFRR